MNEEREAYYLQLMQQASQRIAALQDDVARQHGAAHEPIAIIGQACRFPGAPHPDAFWELLRNGEAAIGEVPAARWDNERYYDPDADAPGKIATRYGGFLKEVDQFDPAFFNIAPREALSLDPQQRLLLEVSWEALETAALPPLQLPRQTGVFVGISDRDYFYLLLQQGEHRIDGYLSSGNDLSTASGRLSYFLGVEGPTLSLDTACASSLVTIHLAVQSLRRRECELALAGGVNLILAPTVSIGASKAHMLAPDGRCKTFDAKADGYVRGEGCALVVLRRLSDAQAAGDRIIAVIRGSAVNHDGRSSGLTVPNGPAQQAVIRQALRDAGAAAHEVGYVEAHGTGTALGDPIEVEALGQVFKDHPGPLLTGSVKTNIGHLESAAGIAGLMKTALALQHGAIPPSLNLTRLNPLIAWEQLPVAVVTELTPWPADRRLAGVSAFSFSGTNCHLVLEAGPPGTDSLAAAQAEPHLFTLSARTPAALDALAERYLAYLRDERAGSLSDICFTLNTARQPFKQRLALVADSIAAVQTQLAAWRTGHSTNPARASGKTAFLFTGQGAQYPGMGHALYTGSRVFRDTIDRCHDLLQPLLDRPLRDLLFDDHEGAIHLTCYTQPALFSLDYALCRMWQSWGVKPDYLMGHSVGEYVAACVAGVFSLEDALRLVTARGRLIQSCAPGGMIAVALDEAGVLAVLAAAPPAVSAGVSVAAVNHPQNTVIAGQPAALQHLMAVLEQQGVRCTALTVSHGFHSPMMEPILAAFAEVAQDVKYSLPTLALISNVTGRPVTMDVTQAAYWVNHIRAAVRFADGMAYLDQAGCRLFIEMGPTATLIGMGLHCLVAPDEARWLPSLQRHRPDWQVLLSSLGDWFTADQTLNWPVLWADRGLTGRKLALPTYPFQRERYWQDPPKTSRAERLGPLLDRQVDLPREHQTLFETRFSTERLPWLADHRVFGDLVSPAAGHLSVLLEALGRLHGTKPQRLLDVVFPEPLVITAGTAVTVQTLVGDQGWELLSFGEDKVVHSHATGRHNAASVAAPPPADLNAWSQQCRHAVAVQPLYAVSPDLVFGPAFRWLEQVWTNGQDAVLATLQPPPGLDLHDYRLHPGLLDACLQITVALQPDQEALARLPFAIVSLDWHQAMRGQRWFCLATRTPLGTWDIALAEEDGQAVLSLQGFATRAARPPQGQPDWHDWLYRITWLPQPQSAAVADYLEPFQHLATRLTAGLPHQLAAAGVDLAQHTRTEAQLEHLSQAWIIEALGQLGCRWQVGDCWQTGALLQQLGIAAAHAKLFPRLLAIVADAGYLQHLTPDSWRVLRLPEPIINRPERLPDEAAFTLLQRCGQSLAAVLDGSCNPLELLFPQGDDSLVRQLYQHLPSLKLMNALVAETIRQVLQRLPAGRTFSILEIGAGTGGTTAAILPVLAGHHCRYLFTDIGQAFLNLARERFADLPWLQYQRLDIEQDPLRQGVAAHQYDVVIAANVVHATRDLSRVSRHLQQLLKPQGVLVLLEDTSRKAWVDLTFGLTDGWWRFEDHATRPDYPLLDARQWQALLTTTGFQTAFALGYPPVGEAVIVAQAAPVPAPQRKPWVIIGTGSTAQAVAEALQIDGHETMMAAPATHLADYAELFSRVPEPAGVVQLLGLEISAPAGTAALEEAVHSLCAGTLYLTQALLRRYPNPPPLTLVTASAQCVTPADRVENYVQGSLWGLGRTIALEHPELQCLLVDLEQDAPPAEHTSALLTELLRSAAGAPADHQIAWRGQQRYAARLHRHAPLSAPPSAPASPYHLALREPGSLEHLQLEPAGRRDPQAGEVEIRVYTSSLNFRDLLKALDLYPDRDEPLGDECAGEVVALGEGVTGLALGDAVIACTAGCLRQYLTLDARDVFPKPPNLSDEDAAGLPGVFMTAVHSLRELAPLRPGDRVLVHAAAGGVGMAAIQLAHQAGAVVHGTASPDKWAALKQLGVRHLYHSRTLDFALQILADTQGEGVDVVLNSLTGEGFIQASLTALRPQGCFIELAKRDIWSAEQMRAARPDVHYHRVDMGQHAPERRRALLHDLLPCFARGELLPPPHTAFPIQQAREAFRYMQQAKHIGKIVITHAVLRVPHLPADASYLITGGLGGLGLLTAQWLAQRGARHLILVGRRAPQASAQPILQQLAQQGVTVKTVQADVAVMAQAAAAVAAVDPRYPLRGIVHAAGVLDDGALLQLDWPRFQTVLAPKLVGAWHLHQLTQAHPLDFFVLYSSATGVFGTRGQSSHAAANTFLDALASHRYQAGGKALSVAWGAWAEIGAAATLVKAQGRSAALGFGAITPERGSDTFDYLFTQPTPTLLVSPIDWADFNQAFGTTDGFHRAFHASPVPPADRGTISIQPQSLRRQLDTLPAGERAALLMQELRLTAAEVLGLSSAQGIDPDEKLMAAGLDSLMSIELRNRLNKRLELTLPATLVFDYPTLASMQPYLLAKLFPPPVPVPTASPSGAEADPDAIDELDQGELAALLAQELRQER